MRESHARGVSPEGVAWAPLAASTVRQKGHAAIGVRTGAMLDPLLWEAGRWVITARRARWEHPDAVTRGRAYQKLLSFHAGNPRTGQPARPLMKAQEAGH